MYWAERPALFVAPTKEPDPAKRALAVLKWFLGTLKQQYGHRPDRRKGKPLNAFLGELFLGRWETEEGNTFLVSEQVNHHPPTTACRIWNDRHGVSLQASIAQKTRFDGTIHMERLGHALLHLENYNEDYLIGLPGFHLQGLIPPPPSVEIDSDKPVFIQSSSGYTAKITFSGKGWIRGKKNSFIATLYATDTTADVLYEVEGQWSGSFTIVDAKTKVEIDTFDTASSPIKQIEVAAIEDQDPLESRRAWSKVTAAIESGNMSAVGSEKSKLEVRQREMRKEEKSEGREWPRRYFKNVEHDARLEELSARIGGGLDSEQTGGIWKWDEEKYERCRPSSPKTRPNHRLSVSSKH